MKRSLVFIIAILAAGTYPGMLRAQTLELDYSTYLGGSGSDYGREISVGTDGRAYVIGDTASLDFPTENPYQAGSGGSWDAFVSALSSTGSALFYSTYLGGSGYDRGYGISLGTDRKAYVTGYTSSLDFPTENPYQAGSGGNRDIFVSALSSTGSALFYSTYQGGSGEDEGYGISLGTDGRAYVTGRTLSSDFPTENPYQAEYGGGSLDAFVSALTSTGSALSYSTYLGGSGEDNAFGISLGTDGRAFVTGETDSSDFPTKNPYQAGYGGGTRDAFVSVLSFTKTTDRWIYDYDGDGTSDIAIFRSASGLWAVRSVTRVYFGALTDETVPGDYDGDRTTDIGVFRPSSGLWALRSVSRIYFGGPADETVPGDYDGSGTWSVGIFRPTSGLWAIRG
ncbi:MAG TPA: hypothetical protein ENH12_04765, partial [Proteobacteria bacterium]|nr:hypothetical protein [Pseudomonadota bacterium]